METAGSRRRGQRGGRRSPPCPKAPCPARRDQGTRLLRAQRDEGQVTTSEGQRVPGGDSTHLEERVPGGGHAGGQQESRGTGGARGDSASGDSGCRKAQHGSRGSWCPEGQRVSRGGGGVGRVQRDSLCFGDSVCLREQGSGETARASRDSTWLGDSRRSGDGTCLGTACGQGTASPPRPSRAPTGTAGQVTCPWHPK